MEAFQVLRIDQERSEYKQAAEMQEEQLNKLANEYAPPQPLFADTTWLKHHCLDVCYMQASTQKPEAA